MKQYYIQNAHAAQLILKARYTKALGLRTSSVCTAGLDTPPGYKTFWQNAKDPVNWLKAAAKDANTTVSANVWLVMEIDTTEHTLKCVRKIRKQNNG